MRLPIVVGVDVGQARDPSAVVGLAHDTGAWRVGLVQSRPLGESYSHLVDAVAALVDALQPADVLTVWDATGVGRPVLEQVQHHDTLGPSALGVTITSGSRVTGGWPHWRVPKRAMVHVATAAVESGDVAMPDRHEHRQLADELDALTHKGPRVEAAGSGHDDQALAWLMAVYAAQRLHRPHRVDRLEIRRGGAVVWT